ncbi:MAG: 2-hydroxyhepta-2,4-diene-1,7-dioate isomerase / 5-carboxymethyl-2-oxo-hex-3- ene-1,7-dioate decarboxylase, partial [uncultured Gemmatimonadaceae bacterium]
EADPLWPTGRRAPRTTRRRSAQGLLGARSRLRPRVLPAGWDRAPRRPCVHVGRHAAGRAGRRALGRTDRPPGQGDLHRPQLRRSRGGDGCPAAGRARAVHEGRERGGRALRCRAHSARVDEDGLGGRARRGRRPGRPVPRGSGRRGGAHRRVDALPRRERARLPDRARGAMDEGEVVRHVRPDGAIPGDARRDRRRACARHVARRQRRASADGEHAHDGVRSVPPRLVHLAVHDARGRRPDLHRHTARRGARDEAAAVPRGGRRRGARDPGPGRAAPGRGAGV